MIQFVHSSSTYTVLKILVVGFLLTGCITKDDIDQFVEESRQKSQRELNITITEPVDRDYDKIKKDGVIRMITSYSSITYFIHQGIELGFEYELVHQFAREYDLALEVVIVGPNESPYDLLNSGKGDLIAANYTITEERDKYVDFTRPYNLVNQTIVYNTGIEDPPATIEGIANRGIPITVRRNSSYYYRLIGYQDEGYDLDINLVSDDMDTEALLFDISNGTYEATVADDNIFHASDKYMDGLVKGPVISEKDTVAWAIRSNADDLENRLNRYLYKHFRMGGENQKPKRSTFLNILRKRYFGEGTQIASYYQPEMSADGNGIISPYDELIKSVADSAGLDWLMIASIIAQETKFNPESQSWAGAVGLMQVMPRYSEVTNVEMLYNEKINLREGVRIIKDHLRHYSYMDSTDQWKFTLGTYNAGMGHIADARRLTIDQNKDPNEWENVEDALLKLMHRQYYKNARFGFCRGIETVRYVKEIINRYKTYKTIVAMADNKHSGRGPGSLGIFNEP